MYTYVYVCIHMHMYVYKCICMYTYIMQVRILDAESATGAMIRVMIEFQLTGMWPILMYTYVCDDQGHDRISANWYVADIDVYICMQ
jgi:hypothetical protein